MTVVVEDVRSDLNLKDFEKTVQRAESILNASILAMGAKSIPEPVNWASFQTDIPADKPVVFQQVQPGSLPVKEGSEFIFFATVFIEGNLVTVAAFR